MQAMQLIHYVSGEYFVLRINKLTLTITRDTRSFEEFFMVIYTGSNYRSYNTKDFSNCISTTVKLEVEVAYNFLLRSRMVSQLSNYTINVSQGYSKVNKAKESWLVIFGICIVFTTNFVLCVVFIIVSYKILQIRYGFSCCYIKKILGIRQRHISRCLKNMKIDQFQNIRVKYDQNNCIICFEDFEPSSEV